jgi:hypothetical protein
MLLFQFPTCVHWHDTTWQDLDRRHSPDRPDSKLTFSKFLRFVMFDRRNVWIRILKQRNVRRRKKTELWTQQGIHILVFSWKHQTILISTHVLVILSVISNSAVFMMQQFYSHMKQTLNQYNRVLGESMVHFRQIPEIASFWNDEDMWQAVEIQQFPF